jgi:hypothetical protein
MHYLQSDLKQGRFIMIEDSLERITDQIQTMRDSDYDYEHFYEAVIYQLHVFDQLQQRNYTSRTTGSTFSIRVIDYVQSNYMNN